MKNLAQKWLTEKERESIRTAVQDAEKTTSGEIVCMVQSASYHYPMADVLGGAAMALPAALVLTAYAGGLFWLGDQNLWLFLGLFAVLFMFFHALTRQIPAVKRCFISRREIDEEVNEAAIKAFFGHRLYQTRESNGVLLFISVFERRAWILADQGINPKVEQGQWDHIITGITTGIRSNRPAGAICKAVRDIGKILEAHFPAEPDDVNELDDVIVSGD